MRVNKPRLHPMARSALVELQASGVEITPDIVLWLHDAASRIAAEPARPLDEIIDWPVECGGVLLYPLTFGAADWLGRLPVNIQNDVRVIAFACAHSKDPEKLAKINGILPVIAAVSKWCLKLRCSMAALENAVDRALRIKHTAEIKTTNEWKDDDAESWEYGAAIRALCIKYPGTSPDYWLWDVSREKACYMMRSGPAAKDPGGIPSEYEIEQTALFHDIVNAIKRGEVYG